MIDNERQGRFQVVIRRVNGSLMHGRIAQRQVVRFSKREHSPRLSDEIRVSTLAHYREGENLERDQRDPMEGRLKLDAAPFYARLLSERGVTVPVRSFSAKAQYAVLTDPWVYCTAFCPVREREAYSLAHRISPDYDTITDILDVNAFALELGVDFAIKLNPAIHAEARSGVDLVQRAVVVGSGFEKVVYVDHGPVVYEDISGTMRTGREPFELESRFCFTKPTAFSYQSEYRFALRTIGEPTDGALRIPVSDALRECTSVR